MSEYKNLGKNVILITIGNLSSKVLSFLLVPLYTAVLSAADYGVSDLINTTINLIVPFFTLLMSEAVMRFALDKMTDKKQVFSVSLWISLIGFALVCVTMPWFLSGTVLGDWCFYFFALYLTTVLNSVISQFVKGIERVTTYTINGVLGTFTFILFNILFLVVFKWGIKGYLAAHILSNIISILYMVISERLWRYCVEPQKLDFSLVKDMVAYSFPLIPNSISWWVSSSAGKYVITSLCGVAVNGVYSIAAKIPTIFSVFSNIFTSAWQISAVNTFGTDDAEEFYSRIYKLYTTFNVLLVSVVICCTKLLASFLFSGEFYSAWIFVPALLLGSMFHSLGNFLGTIYTSAKKTKTIFATTLTGALINILLNIILVPAIGAIGSAFATVVSYFSIWIIRLIDSRKILRIRLNLFADIISFILLISQSVIICADIHFGNSLSVSLFLVIILVNIKTLKDIVKLLLSKIMKGQKNG